MFLFHVLSFMNSSQETTDNTGVRISPLSDLFPFQLFFQSSEQVVVRRGQIGA
jgi:hypothetical protein